MPIRTFAGPLLIAAGVLGAALVTASPQGLGGAAIAQPPSADAAPTADTPTADASGEIEAAIREGAAGDRAAMADAGPTEAAPPAEPLSAEVQALQKQYDDQRRAWAATLAEMQRIQILYHNQADRSPQSLQRYGDLRDRSRAELRELFSSAEQLFALHDQDFEAGSLLATLLDYRRTKSMYDGSFRAAKRLVDAGANLPEFYLMAARSAFIDGHFDEVMTHYMKLLEEHGREKLEQVDQQIAYSLDFYPQWWEEEQEYRRADAEAELPRVLLETSRGPVVIELFEDRAPNTVANFIDLVEQGFYDSTDFYQVIDDLLAMGGDPIGDGTGTSGRFIPDEYDRPDRRRIFRGSLFMAKMPDGRETGAGYVPDSASSQFIIALMPMTPSEQTQTVFGRVIEGMDVVCSLQRVDPQQKKEGEVQLPPDRIESARVIRKRDHDYSVTYTR
jgi:cyclophilin family peptidyl-prolyl cis-trans isomerase